eukprot:scaffold35445_cov112-Isochrysis_galbana.AAC.2
MPRIEQLTTLSSAHLRLSVSACAAHSHSIDRSRHLVVARLRLPAQLLAKPPDAATTLQRRSRSAGSSAPESKQQPSRSRAFTSAKV